jgi:glycosyltransferase 2 family protein
VSGAPRVASASRPKHRISRWLRWALALFALGFVAWVVPVRDRCWDPLSPASTRVSVTRHAEDGSCLLHLAKGDVHIDASACARLQCEPGIASTLTHMRLGILAVAAALYGLGTIAWAARWRALLALAGVDLSLSRVWRLSIEAQAGGVVLPGGIGGDALRIASVAALVPAKFTTVVASVLLDRIVGLAVVAGTAATLAFAWGGLEAGALPSILAALPVAFVAAIAAIRAVPLRRVTWLLEGRLGAIARPVLEYTRDAAAPRAIAIAGAMSVVVACTQFASIRGLVFALGGVPSAEKWVYVGIAMAFVVSAVPSLPGAWGTADAAYVFFFGLAGLHAGTALAVCLVYRLFWYLSGVTGAVLHLALPRSSARPGPASAVAEPPA